MPPAPKRNRIVILYDLLSKNQKNLRQALLKTYLYHHLMWSNKDLVNLVIVNSSRTDNRLNKNEKNKFLHLLEINKEEVPYQPTEVYGQIEELPCSLEECVSWKEAVRLAINILQEDKTRNVITKKILYLTDLNFTKLNIEEKWQNISKDMKKLSGFLYFVGPDATYNKTIENFDDLKGFTPEFSSKEDNKCNLDEIKCLIEDFANVTISNVAIGLHFFLGYKNSSGKQPWNVPLSIGSKISLPVSTSKLLEKVKGFSLVSRSKSRYKEYVYVDAENAERVFPESEVERGLIRHGKFIPCNDNSLFKRPKDRILSIVFATALDNVPEYMMRGPACYMTFKNQKSSSNSFSIFLSQLRERNFCLVVRRIYSKASNPIYLVLIPDSKLNAMKAVQLPFAHTVPIEFPETPKLDKDLDKVPAYVGSFLDSLTINSPTCCLKVPLTPNVTTSIGGINLLNMAGDKFFKETLHLDQVDLDVFDTGINSTIGSELRDKWDSRTAVKVDQVFSYDLDSDKEDFF